MEKNTLNWRIRKFTDDEDSMFFIEADLPNAKENGHYSTLEVMQEDYGDHNGYTHDLRMEDAKLIVTAPKMRDAIRFVLMAIDNRAPGNINLSQIKNVLTQSLNPQPK